MKILFLGSSKFSKIVLESLINAGFNVSCVITQPDKPSGRGHKLTPTEVKVFSQQRGIEVKTFDKFRQHMDEIKQIDYDYSVVASYGQILPNDFLEFKPCVNVHPSLLQKYRGASPIQSSIINGDKITGVTIMKVAQKVDAGDILAQESFETNGEYYLELEEKLAILGGKMLEKVLKNYKNINPVVQNDEEATFTRKFEKVDDELKSSMTIHQLVNRVRALSQTEGTYINVDDATIKILKLRESTFTDLKEGEFLQDKKHFVFGCADGSVEIEECLSPAGKRITGRDYINGHNDILTKRVKC